MGGCEKTYSAMRKDTFARHKMQDHHLKTAILHDLKVYTYYTAEIVNKSTNYCELPLFRVLIQNYVLLPSKAGELEQSSDRLFILNDSIFP